MADNEQALCEALIRIFEEDFEAERSDVTFPEIDHSGPPVEIRLRLGARRFAIEHTLIEPFPGAIQTGKEFQALIADIEADLNGSMPAPGTYRLVFPIHPTQGKHRRTHAALRERIVQWVRNASAELHAECPERLGRDWRPHGCRSVRTTEIDGIPLSLSLIVHWSEKGHRDGALFLSRAVGGDVEDHCAQTGRRPAVRSRFNTPSHGRWDSSSCLDPRQNPIGSQQSAWPARSAS